MSLVTDLPMKPQLDSDRVFLSTTPNYLVLSFQLISHLFKSSFCHDNTAHLNQNKATLWILFLKKKKMGSWKDLTRHSTKTPLVKEWHVLNSHQMKIIIITFYFKEGSEYLKYTY